jgi:hypothetical protein
MVTIRTLPASERIKYSKTYTHKHIALLRMQAHNKTVNQSITLAAYITYTITVGNPEVADVYKECKTDHGDDAGGKKV